MMLCESISEIGFMMQDHIQGHLQGHSGDSFSNRFSFSSSYYVFMDYNTYRCMHSYMPSFMKYADDES